MSSKLLLPALAVAPARRLRRRRVHEHRDRDGHPVDHANSTTPRDDREGPVGPLAPDAIGPLPIGASEDEAREAFGEPDDVAEVNLGGAARRRR